MESQNGSHFEVQDVTWICVISLENSKNHKRNCFPNVTTLDLPLILNKTNARACAGNAQAGFVGF